MDKTQPILALRGDQTQTIFARRIEVTPSSLQRIENEDQTVVLDILKTICIRRQREIGDLFPPLENEH